MVCHTCNETLCSMYATQQPCRVSATCHMYVCDMTTTQCDMHFAVCATQPYEMCVCNVVHVCSLCVTQQLCNASAMCMEIR